MCGLPTSDVGIEEIAADEEFVQSALKSAYSLQIKISGSIFFLVFAYMYYRAFPEAMIFLLLGFFVGSIYFIILLLQWQYKYRQLPMWNKTAQKANKVKNVAALVFVVELALTVLYLYKNW